MSKSSDKRTILGKIDTMSTAYSETSAEIIGKCTGVISNIISFLNATLMGDVVNHDYEIAKTFAASLKVSPGSDQFYVGINGVFASITLIKMNATQDSFITSAYFSPIYKTTSATDLNFVKRIHTRKGNIIQSKTRSFDRNTLTHALKLPFMLASLISWEVEHIVSATNNVKKKGICANSLFHTAMNSNQFSQCAKQVRYLFTSNIGLGASSVAICDMIDFIRTKLTWELLYIFFFRMLKMAAGLCYIFKTGQIGSIIEYKEFDVTFPDSVIKTRSFSYLISSMYYANIYNKFRAFHEVSEAICYNNLFEEEIIYRECVTKTLECVLGITRASMDSLMNQLLVILMKYGSEKKNFLILL